MIILIQSVLPHEETQSNKTTTETSKINFITLVSILLTSYNPNPFQFKLRAGDRVIVVDSTHAT